MTTSSHTPAPERPVAVVTGGGSGIGAAIVRELAARGHRVVVTDLDAAAAETVAADAGAEAVFQLDVTDVAACERVANEIAARQAGLHLWVSNAGVSRMKRLLDITETDYDHTLGVNLKGIFFASQAAARVMAEAGSGVIVNIASMAGKQGRVPFLADYVASKFGVVGLTQAMAYELAPSGIRVNCVCPGYVATPMQDRELAWEAELRGVTPETVRDLWIADTPMGRLEEPEDVARAVAFLAGPDAGFITGEALAVNGGAFMD